MVPKLTTAVLFIHWASQTTTLIQFCTMGPSQTLVLDSSNTRHIGGLKICKLWFNVTVKSHTLYEIGRSRSFKFIVVQPWLYSTQWAIERLPFTLRSYKFLLRNMLVWLYVMYVWMTSSVKVWYVQCCFKLWLGTFWPFFQDFELHMSKENEFTQKGLIKV